MVSLPSNLKLLRRGTPTESMALKNGLDRHRELLLHRTGVQEREAQM